MKELLFKIFPDSFIRFIFNKTLRAYTIYQSYNYDRKRYKKYSDSFLMKNQNELMGNIIKHYHVFEKGLTMPETRLGFGQPKLIVLINECLKYSELFGINEPQLKHAVAVIKEYENFHIQNNFKLESNTLESLSRINSLGIEGQVSKQLINYSEEYFKNTMAPFDKFSVSRHSLRNFKDSNIPIESITKAIELAKKTPSACNRQAWRTYVFTDKRLIQEILKIQGGNRGFGHLADKLIIVTSELGVFGHSFERNQAFVDGGMYLMNLLYALHFNKIGACPLNCSNTPKKDKILQELCNIPPSEVFICMIACGVPPEEFKLAISPRYDISFTNKVIN
ncbi:nitroreductase family protein [Zunongwangia sp. HRR-M8]|uniref:nitroreductase family protein n=1 Tax=Zunongwangia sp. HRR-M8 TaxID=3015170 RepID=UPI0022DE70C2|nr:nitroreductase family protein [Zunongwangia sp. HRR-M8]WBL22041.1 nitroreductase family protein [Zunongwangia sp. HRR-M8]